MIALSTRYDALNTALFLPAGGSRRVRRTFVAALDVRPGHRVLELGCGIGQVTAELLARGAAVTAVDGLAEMLDAARRRAPGARFVLGDVTEVDLGRDVDRIVLSFVLHNFGAAQREDLLRRASGSLHPDGAVGILDWTSPRAAPAAASWRAVLARIEPSPTVGGLLDGALHADVARAGLLVARRRSIANGRAEVLVLTKPAR